MKRILPFFFLLALLLPALAPAGSLVPRPGQHDYALTDTMDFLEDTSGLAPLEVIASPALQSSFTPARASGPSYGFRHEAALWFRIDVDFSAAPADWHLVETHPLLDRIEFFLPGAASRPMGDTLPFAERLVRVPEFVQQIPREVIAGPQPVRFYVRVQGKGALNVDLRLMDGTAITERTAWQSWAFGLFYGALLIMIFLHMTVGRAVHEQAQTWYVVFVSGLLVLFLAIDGVGLAWIWPHWPVLNTMFPQFACVAIVGALQFTRHFLDTDVHLPVMDLALQALSLMVVALAAAMFILPSQIRFMLGAALPVVPIPLMFAAGILRLTQGYRPARFFVTAWACLVVGVLTTALTSFGIIHWLAMPVLASKIGIAVMLMQLSLALGERVRFLRTDHERIRREIAHQSTHDRLTGLPNRTSLELYLPVALEEARAAGLVLGVLYIDIDDLKGINDSFGHHTGDAVLAAVAVRMKDVLNGGGLLVRINGDEMVAVTPACENADDVLLIAHNVIAAVARPFDVPGGQVELTCSIGISIGEAGEGPALALVQDADLAMQKAKRGGPNNYALHTGDLNSEITRRIQLRNDLASALREQRLEIHYQPVLDRRSGRPCAFEAFVRWHHPERGQLPAREFIQVAEESGRIVAIGRWVLETACRTRMHLLERGFQDSRMVVNISPQQFQRTDFVEQVRAVLATTGMPGSLLELDFTETALLQGLDQTRSHLEQLRELGVLVAIDDFGTGNSSLGHLRHLPVAKVKIDETFVRNVISDVRDAAITRAIISLGHHLDLTVVAEGIETEAQFDFLRKSGCDAFQGRLFCAPVPLPQLEEFLLRRRSPAPAVLTTVEPAPTDTILLVDDEPNILRALVRVLRPEGYQVLTANSAEEGFALLARHDVNLIISDQRMPVMTGTEFLSRVKEIHPDTVRMILSGYTDLKTVTDAVNQGAIYRFLTKPWDDAQLRDEVRRGLAHCHRQQERTTP